MWQITLRHKYPSHFPVGSRSGWFAGARKGRKFSLDVFLSLPLSECQLHQFTPPHVWRHLSIFQISHFGANDPPWRKQFLQCGNSQISIKAQCLCLSPHRRSKFNWKTAFKVIPQLYNYTEDACLHVAQFAPIYCTFCTVKTSAPFSGCKFPSFGSKWSIIAHIQANTLLWEVLPSSFILNLRRMKKKIPKSICAHVPAGSFCLEEWWGNGWCNWAHWTLNILLALLIQQLPSPNFPVRS